MSAWLSARNILAVRLDNAGDVVMLGPALRAIKESSSEAHVTLLATPAGTAVAPLLPWVDDVITWRPVWQDLGSLPFDPAREQQLVAVLAQRAFDGALIFTSFSQTPHVAGYVCYLAGIPLRAGESKEFGGGTLTTELRDASDAIHQVERNIRLVERLGFVARNRQLAVATSDEARLAVSNALLQAGLTDDRPFVLVHPGASAQARRYPDHYYGAVARGLVERGWQVLITGVERERALVERVARELPNVASLVGQTTLLEYAALIERAALVVCGNTLPMHLADAVSTPLLVLYSGTDLEEQWRPRVSRARLLRRPTPCYPCYLFECPIGQPCLDISPEEVIDAADVVMGTSGSPLELTVGRALEDAP